MGNVIGDVHAFVLEEFGKEHSHYKNSYAGHMVPMVERSLELAKTKNADLEVVEIAAWLHDIGSIVHGRKDHHITGAEIAEKKLKELNYPEKKIQLVKACILNHRGSQNNERESLEEKIISDADAVSAFDNVAGLIEAAIVWEKLNQFDAMDSVLKKLERKYNQLFFDESKGIVKDKYEAAKVLFKK